jgi:putative polyhydroxyalkanoate system protein
MRIKRSHNLGIEEAKRRADLIAVDLAGRFNLRSRWEGDQLRVKGSGVDGRLLVEQSSVELRVRLGLALKLLEGPIHAEIKRSMAEHLV